MVSFPLNLLSCVTINLLSTSTHQPFGLKLAQVGKWIINALETVNKQQKNQCWLQSHFLKSVRPKQKEDTIEMVRHQNLSATYMISVMFPEAWTASSRRFMTLSLHTQGSSMLQSRIKAALLYSHTGIHLCLCQLRVPHSKDVERLLGLAESCLHGKQGQPGDRQELPSFPAEEGEFTTQAKCRMLWRQECVLQNYPPALQGWQRSLEPAQFMARAPREAQWESRR